MAAPGPKPKAPKPVVVGRVAARQVNGKDTPANPGGMAFNAQGDLLIAAGAAGHAAIYTERAKAIHILRMVILRVGAYMDYLILKMH